MAPWALRPGARRSAEFLDADEGERNRLALRLAGGPLDAVTISGVQLDLNLVAFDRDDAAAGVQERSRRDRRTHGDGVALSRT